MEIEEVRPRIKALITAALASPYVSASPHAGVLTGNHYQSVLLDGQHTGGFRTSRSSVLDTVKFSGRRVLDLGSNLGEISRYARKRGASMVDGYEYDQHFIDMANLISAYQRVTRVSFHRRDITDPSAYDDSYDLVLALSVFVYVEDVLGLIAGKTDALLLETHMLEGNLERYVDPVLEHFPHHHILGDSEWGTNQDAHIRRGVVAFTKTRQQLLALLDLPQAGGR